LPPIAILQAPGEDVIERGSGDDSELAALRHGAREPPTGDAGSYATLDNLRTTTHKIELFQGCAFLNVRVL
jgi:hypothetical protein